MRRGWGGAAAVAVTVLLGVTACTGGGEPTPILTVETTDLSPTEPSQSASPTVTVPPLPPEATTQDAAGAEAFVRHWFGLVNYGYQSGDVAPLQDASTAECAECDDYVDAIMQVTSGGSVAGTAPVALTSAATGEIDGSDAFVSVTYGQVEFSLVAADGSTQPVAAEQSQQGAAIITWAGGSWNMFGIGA